MTKLMLVLAAALAFAGCSQRSTLTDGRFVVGFDADFPPYGFKDGSEYKGFDLDLARAVCAKKGWTFVANPINWDAKDMELNSGAIDCIWNGFTMQGREAGYTWTAAYIDNSQVVLVKKGVDKYETLGKTFKGLVVVPNYNQAVNELNAGAVDAVAMDVGVAKKKMADLPGKFELLGEIVMTETYGIGFKKGNVALKDLVEAELKALFADGTAAALAAKYGIEPKSLILK